MSARMRVLHVIPTVALEHGGPSYAVRAMAKAVAERGYAVEIAATSFGTPQGREAPRRTWTAREDEALVRLFPRDSSLRWHFSLALTRWLFAHARDYDVIHVHAPFSYPTLPACAAARRAGVPYVYRTLGTLDPYCMAQGYAKKRAYFELLERRNLRTAAAVHVTSEMERLGVSRLAADAPFAVIPIGVDLPARRPEARARGSGLQVLFLGRLDPIKAIPVLIEALATTRARTSSNVELLVAGDGPSAYVAELQKLADQLGVRASVRFLGFLRGDAKSAVLRGADVLVLPAYHENFGVAAVEALAVGLPVIVSDGVAIAHEVRAHGAGLVVPAGNPAELANAIERMLDEPTRRSMSVEAASLARSRYSTQAMGAALADLYDRVARKSPASALGQVLA